MSHKETILYSLKMIDNLVRKLMDRHITADKQGLTIMHTWIVGFLYNNPDRAVYQRDIEREFRINRATVSGMISLMEQKGLIRRLSVSHDARPSWGGNCMKNRSAGLKHWKEPWKMP